MKKYILALAFLAGTATTFASGIKAVSFSSNSASNVTTLDNKKDGASCSNAKACQQKGCATNATKKATQAPAKCAKCPQNQKGKKPCKCMKPGKKCKCPKGKCNCAKAPCKAGTAPCKATKAPVKTKK